MIDLRDMEVVRALETHRHFARAAAACGISQPAFSARIRNLEAQLGAAIVNRGNRFLGFTDEGEIVLSWARRLLDDAETMRQEISAARDELTGELIIGSVPTALPYAAEIPAKLRARHPKLTVQIQSASSREIQQGVERFSLHAGITYIEADMPSSFDVRALYDERYMLLAPQAVTEASGTPISWTQASVLPLCLLTRDMQNRRIIDDIFQSIGAQPVPVVTTNALTAALTQLGPQGAATIAPERLVDTFPDDPTVHRHPLIEPVVTNPIGLITAAREPVPPALAALIDALNVRCDNK